MTNVFADLGLHPTLLRALDECGYRTPTPVQARAVPVALSGRDLIACANTGTGKTAAFVLPALQRLAGKPRAGAGFGPRVLVLSPTRELANQILDAVRRYSKYDRVFTGAILGGMPYPEQIRMLSRRVDLIVGTPGRLLDHLERGRLDLSGIEMLVVDEADRMLDLGFLDDVERIAAACPADRQTLMFTATLDEPAARLARRLLNDPERIDVAPTRVAQAAIDQRLLQVDDLRHKERLLAHFAGDPAVGKAIVFAGTKRDAERLAGELAAQGHAAAALHGDMKQPARSRTIEKLRRGRIRLLVATDVAARGIDVADVTHVINFDLPRGAEDYVHRIGRTGRAGATGTAYTFATAREGGGVRAIEAYVGSRLALHVVPGLEPTERPRPLGPKRPWADRRDENRRPAGYIPRGRNPRARPEGGARRFG